MSNTLLYIRPSNKNLIAATQHGEVITLSAGDNICAQNLQRLYNLDNVIHGLATPPEFEPSIAVTFTIPNGNHVTQTFNTNPTNGEWQKIIYCTDELEPCAI